MIPSKAFGTVNVLDRESYNAITNRIIAILFAILFTLFFALMTATSVFALDSFNLDSTLNKNSFYTLPMLGSEVLEQVVNTTLNSTPINTNVEIDFVNGTSTGRWWNSSFPYRTKYSVTVPSGLDGNYSVPIYLDISPMINTGKIRSDLKDLRILEDSTVVPYYIDRLSSSGILRVIARLSNYSEGTKYVDLYYGNSSISYSVSNSSVYELYDAFNNISRWNISSGNWSIVSGELVSENNLTSKLLLYNISSNSNITHNTEISPAIISFKTTIKDNSTISLIASDNPALSNSRINLTLSSKSTIQNLCVDSICQQFIKEMLPLVSDNIELNVSSSKIALTINGVKYSELSGISSRFNLGFIAENQILIDDFKILKLSSDASSSYGVEQNLIRKISTISVGGIFGWNIDLSGYPTGTYSLWTFTSKDTYENSSKLDIINVYYNKIRITISEEGKVTIIAGKYVSDLTGVIRFDNPNAKNLTFAIPYNSDITLIDLTGNRFNSTHITLNPLQSLSYSSTSYYMTGISYTNPLSAANSVLGGAILSANGLNNQFELADNRFTQLISSVATEIGQTDSERAVIVKEKTEFTLDILAQIYGGIPLLVQKSISSDKVLPGDVITVKLKVSNLDMVSKKTILNDFIPDEFVNIEGKNIPTDKKVLEWKFDINKRTSKEFEYKMMYVGNSTGAINVEPAKGAFDVYNISSNNITLFRDVPKLSKLFVQKNVEYLPKNKARVYLTIVNVGDYSLKQINVAEQIMTDTRITQESISSPFTGEWIIPELKTGETWKLNYLSDNHELIENIPNVYSDDKKIEAISDLYVTKFNTPMKLWSERQSNILIFILLALLVEFIVFGNYIYRNFGKGGFNDGFEIFTENIRKDENYILTYIKSKFIKFYNNLPALPKRIFIAFERINLLIKFGIKHIIIFLRVLRIKISKVLPGIWGISDIMKELSKSEKVLLVKMFIDYVKSILLQLFGVAIYYLKIIFGDIAKRVKEDMNTRKQKIYNDMRGMPDTPENEKVEEQKEDLYNFEVEEDSYKKYLESKKVIEEMMKDLKK